MSTAGYAFGLLTLLLFAGSLGTAAVDLRRRLLPGWHGAEARLGELVLGSAAAVVLVELLGLCSLLRRPALVVGAVALAVGVRLLPRRQGAFAPEQPPVEQHHQPLARFAATAGVIGVLAEWLVSIHRNARVGIHAFDSLHYHLTFAAHFARDHSILPTHRLDALGVSTWYPLNSELLQGAGMVLLKTTALSLLIDLLALVGVLLAAWVLGSQYGAGPLAVLATCLPLAFLGPMYAGTGNNDWTSTWPLLAALALLSAGRARGRQLSLNVVAVAGLAGGLAIGTKLTVLAPTVALFAVAVALSKGFRWRAAAVSASAHLLSGGYWYVRDLLIVGNPVPATKVGIGPLQLPKPPTPYLDTQDFSVLHYLTDAHVIRRFFVPGLHWFLGPAWPAVLALVLVGFALALQRVRQDPILLGASAVGLISLATWVVTPTSAGGPQGNPFLFPFNIRYALVGFAVGLLLLAVRVVGSRLELPVTLALIVVLAVTLARRDAWLVGWPREPLVVVVALALLVVAATRLDRRVLVPSAVVLVLVGGLVAVKVERHLDEHAYQAGSPRDSLYAAVRQESGQKIGIVGLQMEFPFFGRRLGNEVSYLGRTGTHHSYDDFDSCAGLLVEVARQKVTRVVVQPYENRPTPDAGRWLLRDPHVRVLFTNSAGVVLAVQPGVDPRRC
ncbi:MAG: hypothetical protein JWM40_162 [Frankiales bacterium]|nr:hypothetical protein [Frankiales bacterium]